MSVLRKMGEWISPSDPDLVEKTLARLNEQDKWNDVFSTKLIELLDNIDKIKSETRKCLRDVTERLQEAESATQAESLLLDKAKEFGDASQRLEFAHTAQKCARALAEEAKTTFESASATLADAQRNEEIARRDEMCIRDRENITMLKFIGAMISGLVTMGAAVYLGMKRKK